MSEIHVVEMKPVITIRLEWKEREDSQVFDTGKIPLEVE